MYFSYIIFSEMIIYNSSFMIAREKLKDRNHFSKSFSDSDIQA